MLSDKKGLGNPLFATRLDRRLDVELTPRCRASVDVRVEMSVGERWTPTPGQVDAGLAWLLDPERSHIGLNHVAKTKKSSLINALHDEPGLARSIVDDDPGLARLVVLASQRGQLGMIAVNPLSRVPASRRARRAPRASPAVTDAARERRYGEEVDLRMGAISNYVGAFRFGGEAAVLRTLAFAESRGALSVVRIFRRHLADRRELKLAASAVSWDAYAGMTWASGPQARMLQHMGENGGAPLFHAGLGVVAAMQACGEDRGDVSFVHVRVAAPSSPRRALLGVRLPGPAPWWVFLDSPASPRRNRWSRARSASAAAAASTW